MAKSPKPAPPPEARKAESNWLLDTPPAQHYMLLMDNGTGEILQDMEMTREEYIFLKVRLARLRRAPAHQAARK